MPEDNMFPKGMKQWTFWILVSLLVLLVMSGFIWVSMHNPVILIISLFATIYFVTKNYERSQLDVSLRKKFVLVLIFVLSLTLYAFKVTIDQNSACFEPVHVLTVYCDGHACSEGLQSMTRINPFDKLSPCGRLVVKDAPASLVHAFGAVLDRFGDYKPQGIYELLVNAPCLHVSGKRMDFENILHFFDSLEPVMIKESRPSLKPFSAVYIHDKTLNIPCEMYPYKMPPSEAPYLFDNVMSMIRIQKAPWPERHSKAVFDAYRKKMRHTAFMLYFSPLRIIYIVFSVVLLSLVSRFILSHMGA